MRRLHTGRVSATHHAMNDPTTTFCVAVTYGANGASPASWSAMNEASAIAEQTSHDLTAL